MGSWAELDAIYPEGTLTPGTALVVALGYVSGATSVYADRETGILAPFLTKQHLDRILSNDICKRAEVYLQERPRDTFLTEANRLLTRKQKLSILLTMLDAALARGVASPQTQPLFQQFFQAFDIGEEQLRPHLECLMLKNNADLFPQ